VVFISHLEGKRILITGVAGFIGSNLGDYLLEMGAVITGIDNLFNGRLENLKNTLQNPNIYLIWQIFHFF